ncbi:magnesium-translocating P-type ATPase [Mycetocola saprophilus]|uniref:magnesium-translocating P-type ATPase n=1 Tax=Mycetocola saprophilus TaxID=76636 RepID=UPI0009E026D9|nr:magnesium-translocating P-type ATPase [Mycetocola saprophilus]
MRFPTSGFDEATTSFEAATPPPTRPTRNPRRFTETAGKGLSAAQQELLLLATHRETEATILAQQSTLNGLTPDQVRERTDRFGANEIGRDKPAPAIVQFLKTFLNPFILILLFLVGVMWVTDVWMADPADGPDYTGMITVSIMVLVSAVLRFWQEYRSAKSAQKLSAMVRTTTAVTRLVDGTAVTRELPITDVVPGDVLQFAAGDMLPADVRFLRTKDLQLNQAMLTGEALPAEKTIEAARKVQIADILDAPNLGFMGTSVVSGSGTAIVIGTGDNSYFGTMARTLVGARPETAFDVGIRRVSFTLIRFMLIMVPVVFIINGLTKDWTTALLFGVTTAVGLTPEMLPLIVTANLAKGAQHMAKHKVIVKRLNSIQNLGAMDILATDKTGTLTEDRIVLERHLDVDGRSSESTLGYGAINAHFQTGLRNLLDGAVLTAAGEDELDRITAEYTYVDEMPFDFVRRRMSVVVGDGFTHTIITKGAVEEVMGLCTTELHGMEQRPLSAMRLMELEDLVAEQNALGLRVLAVAIKTIDEVGPEGDETEYTLADEQNMTLVGFLAFLDPPKASAAEAIRQIQAHGTTVKVITGDNALVAATVGREVGLDVGTIVTGPEIENLSLVELGELAETTTIFAKITPTQKARIVEAMRTHGHTVGFLGDGINDAPALRTADVGISVDTAVDIAKESADIILLEKDLTVLEQGMIEGRRTFINTMKYISMTASSNFGNMFSVLVASALLPFIPMIPIVVLVQNLTYDLSMLTLPWDKVDPEDLKKPRAWESKSLSRFMIRIGPLSSIFDITTFALMWFVFAANTPEHAALFQSGWFIESIISQTLIVHLLRTRKLPFIQSRASISVLLATGAVCVFGLVLPFIGWGQSLGLVPLPWTYFPWLIATLGAYCVVVQLAKRRFIARFNSWI